MKFISVLFVCFVVATSSPAKTPVGGVAHDVKILRAIDGDTVVVAAPYLPAPLKPELSIRIYGIDSPEKGRRAKCSQEDQKGQLATKFVNQALAKSLQHRAIVYDWDKYGGRVLGDIILDGRSLRAMLIEQGLAREYHGAAKQSWCR